jgi:hypothetical protein
LLHYFFLFLTFDYRRLMISITTVQSEEDVLGILALLQANLRQNLSLDMQTSGGYLSIEYQPDLLRRMNQVAPSIIAKDSASKVVGYALMTLPEFAPEVPDVDDLVSKINILEYKGKPLRNYTYYIMGQVCVADGFRGQNIFDRMYNKHRELYVDRYQLLITCISNKNARSLRAHARVGFETVHSFNNSASDETWHIVLWDWQT